VIDGQHVRGLALKSPESSYTLWALWVWIYCIIWWFIQVRFGVGVWMCCLGVFEYVGM
jgi:H+-transporting ATPase